MKLFYSYLKCCLILLVITLTRPTDIQAQCTSATCPGGDGAATAPTNCAASTKTVGPGSFVDLAVTANTTYTVTLGTQSTGPATLSGITVYGGAVCSGTSLATNTTASPYTVTFNTGANTTVRIFTCRAGTWPANNVGQGSATLSYNRITPSLSGTAAVCAQATSTITCAASGGATVTPTWSTTNGTMGTTTASASSVLTPAAITAPTANVISVVTASNGTCTNTFNVTSHANPVISALTSTYCNSGSATISGVTSNTTGTTWSATAGSFSPTSGTSVAYTIPSVTGSTQNQTVTVTATNGSCARTATIRIDNNPVISSLPLTYCNSGSATISGVASSVTGTAWSATAGSFSPTTGTSTTYTIPTVTAPTQNQTVTVTATNGACAPTATIRIDNNPVISSLPSTYCNSGSATISGVASSVTGTAWSATAGSFSPTTGTSTAYTIPSVTGSTQNQTVTVTATNGACAPTATIRIDNNPVISGLPAAYCNSGSATISGVASTVTGTSWSATGGSFSPTTGTSTTYTIPTIAPPVVSGTYTITATNGACAPTTTIRIDDNPSITSAATDLCEGSTRTLTNDIGGGGTWSGTNSSVSGNTFTAPILGTGFTSRTETVSLVNGVCAAVNQNINTVNTPVITSSNTDMCEGATRTLQNNLNTGGGTWSGSGVSGTTFTAPTPTGSGSSITITLNNLPCPATTQNIFVNKAIDISSIDPSSMCSGDTKTMTPSPAYPTTSITASCGTCQSGAVFTAPTPSGTSANYNINFQNGACTNSYTQTVYKAATITSSSADMCEGNTRTLTATPAGGVFSGTGVSGTTFTAPTVSSGSYQDVVITYTVIGSPCTAPTQTIRVYRTPTATVAATTVNTCGLTSASLGGNTPSFSTATQWTQVSGPGSSTFSASTSPSSTATASVAGTYDYKWTVTNGACSASADVTNAVFTAVITGNTIGSDEAICSGSSPSTMNTVGTLGGGTGSYTYLWESSTTSPGTAGYSAASGTNNTVSYSPGTLTSTTWYRRTVTSGNCTSVSATPVKKTPVSSSSSVVLSGTVNNGANCAEQCTEAGWTYYADPSDNTKWLFAIRKNGNTFNAVAKITVNGSGNYTSLRGSSSATKNGSYLLSRYWNVNITSGSISTPVDVKFYYDPTDSANAEATRTTDANTYSCPPGNRSAWKWFKSTGADFSTSNVVGNSFNFANIALTPAAYGSDNGVRYVEFDGITSFSGGSGGVGFNVGVPSVGLPVTLVSFKAEPVDNSYIRAQWVTASETDNKGFDIERSSDGISFEKIGWVDGAGNSNTTQVYTFDDTRAVPNTIYYYRLKQIDVDGKYTYSEIVSAVFMGPKGFVIESLRPNPATTKVVIHVVSHADVASKVEITDLLGRSVLTQDWQLSSGFNGTEIDLGGIANGTYTVTIYSGNVITSKRLVVSK